MGWKRHYTFKCHYCPRKDATGGTKKSGSLDKPGWLFTKVPGVKDYIHLCPECARKHLKKTSPLGNQSRLENGQPVVSNKQPEVKHD